MSRQVTKYKINDDGDIVRSIFEDDHQFWCWSHWKYAGNYTYYDTFEEAKEIQHKRIKYELEKLQEQAAVLTKKIKDTELVGIEYQNLKEIDCMSTTYGNMSPKPSNEFR